MKLMEVNCSYCGKKFIRELGRFNEAIKFGWKQYCSDKCQFSAKSNRIEFKCGSHSCSKTFKRVPSEITPSGVCFCSKSCAASVNNPKSPKRQPKIRICPNCGQKFTGRRKYCSPKCYPKTPIIPIQQIIEEIKSFYKKNGRIPFKKEFYHAKAARFRFGTWNKAIKAAGFGPNPVKFAKKYLARDGHLCDSLSEKIIDDWLSARKIPHERNFPYPGNLKFTADFKVDGILIEFFGLKGEFAIYDKLRRKKLSLIKRNNLKVIFLYPKDIFPKFQLDKIFSHSLTHSVI